MSFREKSPAVLKSPNPNDAELKAFIGVFEPSECETYGHLIDLLGDKQFNTANPYVPGNLIRKFHIRRGQKISAKILPRTNFPNPKVEFIEAIDDLQPFERQQCIPFERLTAIRPEKQLILEHQGCSLSPRIIDLFCPLAKGQRGIIVSPPRCGKTLLLHEISKSISVNYPEIAVIVALIDERPEEVTDFKRSVDAEIYSSSNDQGTKSHIRIAQLASDRAKSLAESGKDVVMFIDSLTRLARAYNSTGLSGRTMTGGIDARAMELPRGIFSAARDTENRGSLTIIATALVETGSKMDDLIFQELKGTGNLEIVLSRKIAELRIWPAIDLHASGARNEEAILSPQALYGTKFLRRAFSNSEPDRTAESLIKRMSQCNDNKSFLSMIVSSARL